MKKLFFLIMAFAVLLGATSCTSCNKESKQTGIDVENIIKSDIGYMDKNYTSYVWYESSMVLANYLDEENCDGSVADIEDIFQTGFGDTTAIEQNVVMIKHVGELMKVNVVDGIWCEDLVLIDKEIMLTYKDAFDRLMEADCIKPHSRFCVLRRPLGPYECNPQYIFGNSFDDNILFVDATTGDVRDYNPAFEKRD